ncbi:magnesium chelatase, partial [Streptomyces sp. MCAF7]
PGGGQPPQGAPEQAPPSAGSSVPEQRTGPDGSSSADSQVPDAADGGVGGAAAGGPGGERAAVGAAEPFRTRRLDVPGLGEGAAGRRSRARTAHGRTTGARRPRGTLSKLHLSATVRAAAPHQRSRGRQGPGLVVRRDDLREAVREGREGNLVLFVVDA